MDPVGGNPSFDPPSQAMWDVAARLSSPFVPEEGVCPARSSSLREGNTHRPIRKPCLSVISQSAGFSSVAKPPGLADSFLPCTPSARRSRPAGSQQGESSRASSVPKVEASESSWVRDEYKFEAFFLPFNVFLMFFLSPTHVCTLAVSGFFLLASCSSVFPPCVPQALQMALLKAKTSSASSTQPLVSKPNILASFTAADSA